MAFLIGEHRGERFRHQCLTTLFISRAIVFVLNAVFILLDLTISTYVWLNIYHHLDESIKVDLPASVVEQIISTKKCGIVLTSLLVVTIASLGLLGSARSNTNLLITYDVAGLLAIIVLWLGHRNYHQMPLVYYSVIAALGTAVLMALILIREIKAKPYRIRRQLLLVHDPSSWSREYRESLY